MTLLVIFDFRRTALVSIPKGITTSGIISIAFRTSPFTDDSHQLVWVITNVPISVAIATC